LKYVFLVLVNKKYKKRGIEMLENKWVSLKPVRRSDIELFMKWFNNAEVVYYLTSYLPRGGRQWRPLSLFQKYDIMKYQLKRKRFMPKFCPSTSLVLRQA
jgi:hypothetical protein